MAKQFSEFVNDLSLLQARVGDIQDFFAGVFKDMKLDEELKFLEGECNRRHWRAKVEDSITQLFTISKYKEAAKAVKVACNALGVKSKFPIVEEILRSSDDESFQQQPLKSIDNDLIQAGTAFAAWEERHIKVLDSLHACGNLLAWLKANIQDRNDLKTFYDLATISAGESDHELDRVSHFYQAVSAYSPLLLELKEDCSFAEFEAACKSVFTTLASDREIANKLVESNRNLEWIKACKDHQGSVEQSSLTLVSKINQSGVFHVGLPDGAPRNSGLENCIKLRYDEAMGQAGQALKREMTLEQLKELNSKLMLITAGADGKKDVERFSRILSLVELVSRHYLDLLKAGCHLFFHWTMKVRYVD